jgi:hypothetical protein
VEVTILLCDSAEAVNGKLYILGGGWSVTGPGPVASAIALRIDVPWNDTNRPIAVRVELLDADGAPAQIPAPGPDGATQGVAVDIGFEVGRPPGTPLDAAVAFPIPPLQLRPGSRYVWKVSIDGETKDHWQVAFTVRPMQQGVGPAGIPGSF